MLTIVTIVTIINHSHGYLMVNPYNYMGVSINGEPQSGWFIRGNPIKMDDLGVPLFQETSISLTIVTIVH